MCVAYRASPKSACSWLCQNCLILRLDFARSRYIPAFLMPTILHQRRIVPGLIAFSPEPGSRSFSRAGQVNPSILGFTNGYFTKTYSATE